MFQLNFKPCRKKNTDGTSFYWEYNTSYLDMVIIVQLSKRDSVIIGTIKLSIDWSDDIATIKLHVIKAVNGLFSNETIFIWDLLKFDI